MREEVEGLEDHAEPAADRHRVDGRVGDRPRRRAGRRRRRSPRAGRCSAAASTCPSPTRRSARPPRARRRSGRSRAAPALAVGLRHAAHLEDRRSPDASREPGCRACSRSTTRASGIVTQHDTAARRDDQRRVVERLAAGRSAPARNASSGPRMETSATSFCSAMKSLRSGGTRAARPAGRMTWRSACVSVRPERRAPPRAGRVDRLDARAVHLGDVGAVAERRARSPPRTTGSVGTSPPRAPRAPGRRTPMR